MEGNPSGGQVDYFQLTFSKRPPEELYAVQHDPFQLNNLATDPAYAKTLSQMQHTLHNWMQTTGDLRASEPETTYWDTVRYTPNYQSRDFDLEEKINAYEMVPLQGKKIGCR